MATFTPGCLHLEHHALNQDDYSCNLRITYELADDPKEGQGMQFTLDGSIQDKPINESFFLAKDQAFDFARHAFRIAQKHGLPDTANILPAHRDYDLMFEDVREQLHRKSGDPVEPEHLE